ncbi:MAG: phosphatidate cytidylyltransferase [Clostridia bacterium]|nr:phosphatidate cytidylyltransferase [Clostridia bacterium]MBR7111855.1 phosphatidate cytidylyltransferase [Clostridia bacterium]
MKTRVTTAVIAILCITPFFIFSEALALSNPLTYLFPLLISGIAFVSVWEMLHCQGLDKNYVISVPLYLIALAFPILARVMHQDMAAYVRLSMIVALVTAIYLFAVLVFQFGKVESGKIALLFMTCFYIVGANAAIVVLRDMEGIGKYLFLIPYIFSWVTDSFAYFCGRAFGKHKLIEAVSPKKTVEGAIGGFVFCAITAILYGVIVRACYGVTPNYLVLGLGGIVIGVVSQIGDLVMSAIKREQGVKDYGKLLPGHGGLLDRFDSSMAVTVVVLLISMYFPIFTV